LCQDTVFVTQRQSVYTNRPTELKSLATSERASSITSHRAVECQK